MKNALKSRKIWWDLDGTLRDLALAVWGVEPEHWNKRDASGRNTIDIVNDNLFLLEKAPPTEYLRAVNGKRITILSAQLPHWTPYTRNWLYRWIPNCTVIYTETGEEKLPILEAHDALLVEDHPNLSDYSRILLIDHPYNRHVINPLRRICSVEELEECLSNLS